MAGDELSLEIGEIITDITVIEEVGYNLKINSSTKMFPENFVNIME